MRLAFITHEPFYPPSGGGSAEAVYLIEEMRRRNWEIDLFCPALESAEETEAKFGVKIHQFTTWKMGRYARWRTLKYLAYPAMIARFVIERLSGHPPDALFSQHAISAVAAGKLKKRLGSTLVMNFLDHLTGFMEAWPPCLAPPPLLNRLKKYELSLPVRYHADAVLTVSDPLADRFAAMGFPRENLTPIYYGYDPDLFPYYPGAGSSQDGVIVMHGSLDHHHLRDIAFDAFLQLRQNQPALTFRIIGHRTAALNAFANRLKSAAPDIRLDLPGFIPYQNIAPLLASASIGVVPYEQSSGAHCAFVAKVVEYLAVGLPVVCTPLENIRTYFKEEPRIKFSGFDGPSFAGKVREWLDAQPSNQTSAQAQAASDRVRQNLNWTVICRRAIDAVENARAGKPF